MTISPIILKLTFLRIAYYYQLYKTDSPHSNKTTLTTFVDDTEIIIINFDLTKVSPILQTHINEF